MDDDNVGVIETTRAMADVPPPAPPATSPKKMVPPSPPPVVPTSSTSSSSASSSSLVSPPPPPPAPEMMGNEPTPPPPSSSPALISPPLILEIEEGTPAAEALRANAEIRVSKLRKVGRSTRLQAGVRAFKSGRHTGDRRGAPAFVAPRGRDDNKATVVSSSSGMPPPTIPEADDEGGYSEDDGDGDGASRAEEDGSSAGGDQGAAVVVDDDHESSSSSSPEPFVATPPPPPPGSPQQQQTPSSSSFQRKNAAQLVAHAALPAAVAAACLAGEEMDRRRGALELPSVDAAAGGPPLQPAHKSPFTNLIKLAVPTAVSNAAEGNVDSALHFSRRGLMNRRSSISEGIGMHRRANSTTIPPDDRRSIMTRRHSSFSVNSATSIDRRQHSSFSDGLRVSLLSNDGIHHMPSEISVDETVKHGNIIRLDDENDSHHSSISDDDEIRETTDPHDNYDDKLRIEERLEIEPIIVNIPDSNRRGTRDETKDESGIGEGDTDHQKALKAKAKKKLIKSSDDAFSFLGPRSVRKWVNRRRSQEETKDTRSYVKGKVIDGKHELYAMSIAVMFGMRTSIGRTNLAMSETAHNLRRWLDNDDLMAVVKYEFPPRVSVIDAEFARLDVHIVRRYIDEPHRPNYLCNDLLNIREATSPPRIC